MVKRISESLRRSELFRRLLFVDRPRPLVSRRSRRAAAAKLTRDSLTPVLVDYYSRDGSTLMMRLLASSPQIAVGGAYPFEHKYFAYLWRWSRLLGRGDWDHAEWGSESLGSIAQEQTSALIGPPPWQRRELVEPAAPDEPSLTESSFEFVWREFSRRATVRTRLEHRDPDAEVRYYAEKHLNTWLLDRDELPPLKTVVLLRDPRDTYASLLAFREAAKVELGQRHATDEHDYLRQFVARQGERLRWIAGLEDDDQTVVVRYDDLVRDLGGVAARLAEWLAVKLDSEAVAADQRMRWVHGTTSTTEQSIGRWKDELPAPVAERIQRELEGELAAVGLEA